MTSIRKFITSLQTRQTDTTEALTRWFVNPGRHQTHAVTGQLRTANGLNALPSLARTELGNLGLTAGELDHIDQWPNDQKESIRQALVRAIDGNRNVLFYWELHGGAGEATDIQDSGAGDIVITFRSPQRKVRISSTLNLGDIATDVG